jgi:formylglycine-generating enzyme
LISLSLVLCDLLKLLKNLNKLLITWIRSKLVVIFHLSILVFPGIRTYIDHSLYAPIVISEGEQGSSALLRSKVLSNNLRTLTIPIHIRNIFIFSLALLTSLIVSVISGLIFDYLKLEYIPRIVIPIIIALVSAIFLSLCHPPIAISFAIVYFKARQISGEVINELENKVFDNDYIMEAQKVSFNRKVLLLVGLIVFLIGWFSIKDRLLLMAMESGNTHTINALIIAGAKETGKLKLPSPPGSQSSVGDLPGMILIQGGWLKMGTMDGYFSEQPVHEVQVNYFYIDETEVTNEQFQKFANETQYVTDAEKASSDIDWKTFATTTRMNHPVVMISWNDATAYVRWAGKRLPTEAEWEYAARGGLVGKSFPWGNNPRLEGMVIFDLSYKVADNQLQNIPTSSVKSIQPNGYGLFHMAGNAWEWCQDYYDPKYYQKTPENNPLGPSKGRTRVLRGGSWYTRIDQIRVSNRNSDFPDSGYQYDYGFRCAKSIQQ